jgi:transposase-like protein
MTIIPKIKCPRCNSSKLYRFGKDPYGYQKYQCHICRRQFSEKPPAKRKPKYPRCPKCGKASFLHHDHKHYYNYRCCDKKCNHSFFVVKPTTIDEPSSSNLKGKTNFKKMRFPLFVIITALNLFFLNNSSTRKISNFLYLTHNIEVSHVTVASWVKKFAPVFDSILKKLSSTFDLSSSDEWHADETVVKINGQKYYIWFVIDSETRFIINFHLSPYRSSPQAFSLFKGARRFGQPSAIVTDRYRSYKVPAKSIFKNSKHIRVKSFKEDISNNIIESFNDTFKEWYKTKRGFNSFESANNLIFTFVFFYNFIRSHSSLNNLTPAQVAGASYDDRARGNWLLVS